jgi:hypothetical protein
VAVMQVGIISYVNKLSNTVVYDGRIQLIFYIFPQEHYEKFVINYHIHLILFLYKHIFPRLLKIII